MLARERARESLRRAAPALRAMAVADDGLSATQIVLKARAGLRKSWGRVLAKVARRRGLPEPIVAAILDCLIEPPAGAVDTRRALWYVVRRDRLAWRDYLTLAHQLCRRCVHPRNFPSFVSDFGPSGGRLHNLLHCSYANTTVHDEGGGQNECLPCPVVLHLAEPASCESSAHQSVALTSFPWKPHGHGPKKCGGGAGAPAFCGAAAAQVVLDAVDARAADPLADWVVGCVLVQPGLAVWVVGERLTTLPLTFTLHRVKPVAYGQIFGQTFAKYTEPDGLAAAWRRHWSASGDAGAPTPDKAGAWRAIAAAVKADPHTCSTTLHGQLGPAEQARRQGRGAVLRARRLRLWLPTTHQTFAFARYKPIPVRAGRSARTRHRQRLLGQHDEFAFVLGSPPVAPDFRLYAY